jgi:hypothetical protein
VNSTDPAMEAIETILLQKPTYLRIIDVSNSFLFDRLHHRGDIHRYAVHGMVTLNIQNHNPHIWIINGASYSYTHSQPDPVRSCRLEYLDLDGQSSNCVFWPTIIKILTLCCFEVVNIHVLSPDYQCDVFSTVQELRPSGHHSYGLQPTPAQLSPILTEHWNIRGLTVGTIW